MRWLFVIDARRLQATAAFWVRVAVLLGVVGLAASRVMIRLVHWSSH